MSSAHSDPELGSTFGPFDLKHRVKLDYTDVVVSKWQSRESGLTVVHIDYDGMYHPLATFRAMWSLLQRLVWTGMRLNAEQRRL